MTTIDQNFILFLPIVIQNEDICFDKYILRKTIGNVTVLATIQLDCCDKIFQANGKEGKSCGNNNYM